MPYLNRIPRGGTEIGNITPPSAEVPPLGCPEYIQVHDSFTVMNKEWEPYDIKTKHGIPEFAVVEMLISNITEGGNIATGVRELSSTLDRHHVCSSAIHLYDPPVISYWGGNKRMLVQVDYRGYIETRTDAHSKFVILGYWENRRFVEGQQIITIPSGTVSPISTSSFGLTGKKASGVHSLYVQGGLGVGPTSGSVAVFPETTEDRPDEYYSIFCQANPSGDIYVSNPTSEEKTLVNHGYFFPQYELSFNGPYSSFTEIPYTTSPYEYQIAGSIPPWDEYTFSDLYVGSNVISISSGTQPITVEGNQLSLYTGDGNEFLIPCINSLSGIPASTAEFDAYYGIQGTVQEPGYAYWAIGGKGGVSGLYYDEWRIKYGTLGTWSKNSDVCLSGTSG